MPTLRDFGSFQIRMYFKDHNPPHVHVVCPDKTVLLGIVDGTVIRGKIGAAMLRTARAWVAEHNQELLAKWKEFQK